MPNQTDRKCNHLLPKLQNEKPTAPANSAQALLARALGKLVGEQIGRQQLKERAAKKQFVSSHGQILKARPEDHAKRD